MDAEALERLAQRLSDAGLESHAVELRAARTELLYLQAPPSRMGRLTARVRATAVRQWSHAVGELRESRSAWVLIQQRMTGGDALTPAETDEVRSRSSTC